MKVEDIDGRLSCSFEFQFIDVTSADRVTRHGFYSTVKNAADLSKELPAILNAMRSKIYGSGSASGPINVLQIGALSGSASIKDLQAAIDSNKDKLNMLGTCTLTVLVTQGKKDPSYYTFSHCDGFKEDPLKRGLRPTFHQLLELSRLSDNFALQRVPAVGHNVQIYVGSEKAARRNANPVVFVRGITHTPGLTTMAKARRMLLQRLDGFERVQSNSKASLQSSSRNSIHALPEIEGANPEEIANEFNTVVDKLKSKLVQRLLKLRVNEIEAKVRVKSIDEKGNSMVGPVRLVASSMQGEWLKTSAFIERPVPVTGVTREFCVIGEARTLCAQTDVHQTFFINWHISIISNHIEIYYKTFCGCLLQTPMMNQNTDAKADSGLFPFPSSTFERECSGHTVPRVCLPLSVCCLSQALKTVHNQTGHVVFWRERSTDEIFC